MAEYEIFTDNTCDITDEMARELELNILPLSVNIGSKTYKTMAIDEFYQQMRDGAMPSTNAVNMGQYIDAFTQTLQSGRDILCLAFSSGMSTTYNSAAMAAKEISPKFPDRKIYVVDTLSASMGEGLLVYLAVQLKREGKTIEQVRDWVEANKLHLCSWIAVNDLFHLKRGGRISSATAVVGSMLGIKPIIHVDNQGHLINIDKARGRLPSLKRLLEQIERTAINPEEQVIFISHSDCYEDAKWLGDQIKEKLGVKEVFINYIGPVIGSHTGIGTVALFFMGTER